MKSPTYRPGKEPLYAVRQAPCTIATEPTISSILQHIRHGISTYSRNEHAAVHTPSARAGANLPNHTCNGDVHTVGTHTRALRRASAPTQEIQTNTRTTTCPEADTAAPTNPHGRVYRRSVHAVVPSSQSEVQIQNKSYSPHREKLLHPRLVWPMRVESPPSPPTPRQDQRHEHTRVAATAALPLKCLCTPQRPLHSVHAASAHTLGSLQANPCLPAKAITPPGFVFRQVQIIPGTAEMDQHKKSCLNGAHGWRRNNTSITARVSVADSGSTTSISGARPQVHRNYSG